MRRKNQGDCLSAVSPVKSEWEQGCSICNTNHYNYQAVYNCAQPNLPSCLEQGPVDIGRYEQMGNQGEGDHGIKTGWPKQCVASAEELDILLRIDQHNAQHIAQSAEKQIQPFFLTCHPIDSIGGHGIRCEEDKEQRNVSESDQEFVGREITDSNKPESEICIKEIFREEEESIKSNEYKDCESQSLQKGAGADAQTQHVAFHAVFLSTPPAQPEENQPNQAVEYGPEHHTIIALLGEPFPKSHGRRSGKDNCV